MRHEKRGFQKNMKNDLYYVEEQLQAYDPTLYIMFNPQKGEWLIMDGLMDIAIMKIPQIGFETLDSRVVEHIRKIHTANGFNAMHEVMEAEEKRAREQKRVLEDLAEDFAKESKEAFINAYDYGRTEGNQKYVQGASL